MSKFNQDRRASKKGFLAKHPGGQFKTWKRRWFVLQEYDTLTLAYYTNEKEEESLGTIDLLRCSGVRAVDSEKDGNQFLFELYVQGRNFLLAADSAQQREDWLSMIEAALHRYHVIRDTTDEGPVKTGYLAKQGVVNKMWRRRWFVLENDILSYYKKEKDPKPVARVNLHSCTGISAGSSNRKNLWTFEIATSDRIYLLAASDEAERDDWMAALEECVPDSGSTSAEVEMTMSDDDDDDDETVQAVDVTELGTNTTKLPLVDQVIIKQGFLTKQGGSRKTSTRRWFVLKGAVLFYQKTEKDKQALGEIYLMQCTGLRVVDSTRKGVKPYSFEIDTPGRVYLFTASSDKEKDEWMTAIEDAIPEELQFDEDDSQFGSKTSLNSLLPPSGRQRSRTEATIDMEKGNEEFDSSADEGGDDDRDDDDDGSSLRQPNVEVAATGNVIKSGYLTKEGGGVRTWKRRFFVLRGSSLIYYKSEKDKTAQGVIDLSRCSSIDKHPPPSTKSGGWSFDIVTPDRKFVIEAETDQLRTEWINAVAPIILSYQEQVKGRPVQADKPTKQGFLEKRGGNNSTKPWKRRYFVLLGTRLFYYNDEKNSRSLGSADLRDCRGLRIVPQTKHGRSHAFELLTLERSYVLTAESDSVRDDWLHALAESIPEAEIVVDKMAGPGRGGIIADAVKVGLLEKQADLISGWVKRLFVLTRDSMLLIYRCDKDRDAIEIIDLNLVSSVREIPQQLVDRPFTFSIHLKNERVFILAPSNSKDLHEWVDLIADAAPEDDKASRPQTLASTPTSTSVLGSPLIQSYLNKLGEEHKSWRRRWFVFQGNEIKYYKRKRDVKELGVISLNQLTNLASSVKSELSLETPNGFAIITPERTFYLGADSDAIRQGWIEAIKAYLAGRRNLNLVAGISEQC